MNKRLTKPCGPNFRTWWLKTNCSTASIRREESNLDFGASVGALHHYSRVKLTTKIKMAIFLFAFLLFQSQASPTPTETKITLKLENVSVAKVLKKIEAITEFKIMYNEAQIDSERKVDVDYVDEDITKVLSDLFADLPVGYEIIGSQIILTGTSVPGPAASKIPTTSSVQQEVSGTVTDVDGMPIPGVSIVEKGTANGTASDFDGNYTISVTSGAVLVFSSLGFATEAVDVGESTTINVTMQEDSEALDEVVVTALGIKKETRKLGYSVAQVDAEEVSVNRTSNFMNSLQGKVAGVNVSALSTGPGGSSKVRIRGQSSISGNNNPLIVVNGVPIDNTTFGTNIGSGGDGPGTSGGGVTSDGGDGFSSINPDDIESMTVLKGATGAALYGSRAKDGVIMITTKTGRSGQGIGVSYNLSVADQNPLDFTDYQYEYGQGENGVRPTSANPTSGQWSFGERFQPGMTQVLYDGMVVPYEPVFDRVKQFYRRGLDVTNSLSLSGGNEKGGFNLSLSNLDSEGITPNNSFKRITVSLGANYNLSEKLSFTTNINYSNEENTNPPNVGQQDNTIPVSLYNVANSMPFDIWRENAFDENGDEIVYSRFRNRTNPYFVLEKQFNNISRDRVFGNVSLKYNFYPWLSAQIRAGQDYWSRLQDFNGYPTGQASRPPAPPGFVNGTYQQEVRTFRETNVDFLLSANKDFGDDFSFGMTFGGNKMKRVSELNRTSVTDFVIRDLYTVQNGRVKNPIYNLQERGVNSLYGTVDLSYKETLYLNGTLRNDWFTTLSPENRSILYPSVSASYVFSNNLEESSWLSFGKIRAAYAEVGTDTDVPPYSDVLFYEINPNLFANSDGLPQPVAEANTNTLPNPDLKPARVSETEIGIDLRMFDSRVNLDVAVYRKTTFDQIIGAQISNSSGFDNTLINSGESRSDGVETLLTLVPVLNDDFRWELVLNASYNKTKMITLLTDEPGESIVAGRHAFNGFLYQVVGEEIGQLAGFGYKFDEQGRQVFADDGRPLRSDEIVFFGSALPNWIGGITNNFRYKNFNASFLVDFNLGGSMISGTNFNATRHGLHRQTLPGRETGVIGDGVNQAGEVNQVATESQVFWEVIRSQQLIEPIVYNSGFWKLRQLRLGYDFSGLLSENAFVKGVNLSLFANNVFIIKKWVPNIDPDSFGYASDNVSGLESTGVPTTRSIGFNLNCKF